MERAVLVYMISLATSRGAVSRAKSSLPNLQEQQIGEIDCFSTYKLCCIIRKTKATFELTAFCMMNMRGFPANTNNQYHELEAESLSSCGLCLCFHHLEEHDQFGQELCEFDRVGRLKQGVENHVDNGVFILKCDVI